MQKKFIIALAIYVISLLILTVFSSNIIEDDFFGYTVIKEETISTDTLIINTDFTASVFDDYQDEAMENLTKYLVQIVETDELSGSIEIYRSNQHSETNFEYSVNINGNDISIIDDTPRLSTVQSTNLPTTAQFDPNFFASSHTTIYYIYVPTDTVYELK